MKDRMDTVVTPLTDPADPGFLALEDSFLDEIGEEVLTETQRQRLQGAIRAGDITFFLATVDGQAVGMCSVARHFSTFCCGQTGVFEDFYVKPTNRGKGVARRLAQTAQAWCAARGVVSLTVCCAPCDEEMYQSLGFDTRLGGTYAKVLA